MSHNNKHNTDCNCIHVHINATIYFMFRSPTLNHNIKFSWLFTSSNNSQVFLIFKIRMYYSSVDFRGGFQLKCKTNKTFTALSRKPYLFIYLDYLEGGGGFLSKGVAGMQLAYGWAPGSINSTVSTNWGYVVKFASRLLCTSAKEQETGPATDMVQMLQRIDRCFISQGNQVSILRSSSTYPILYKLSYHKPHYTGMENNYKRNR